MIRVATIVKNLTSKMHTRAWLEQRLSDGVYTIDTRGRYSFYYPEDAMAFVMKFGGEVIQNDKSFD